MIGSGFFLPAITPLFGQTQTDAHIERQRNFTYYYLAKNVGALFAPIACGYLGVHFGYGVAALLCGGMMCLGGVFFTCHQSLFVDTVQTRQQSRMLPSVWIYLGALSAAPLLAMMLMHHLQLYLFAILGIGGSFLFAKLYRHEKESRAAFGQILILLGFVILFSVFLNQGGSSLNLFIDRIIDRHLLGHLVPAPVFYSLDPIFMLTLGFLLTRQLSRYEARFQAVSVVQKLLLSLVILTGGFAVFHTAAFSAGTNGTANAGYIVLAYLLFPIAELLAFPTVLACITQVSPEKHAGTIMGFYLFAQGIAGYLTGIVAEGSVIHHAVVSTAQKCAAALVYQHFFFVIVCSLVGVIVAVYLTTRSTSTSCCNSSGS